MVSSLFFTWGCRQSTTQEGTAAASPRPYNIIWDSPSENAFGSMPLGNGDIALNVWVEQNGDLCFYIGKTDSWGDNGRLLKVGKVRVECDPPLIFPGAAFSQELDLQTGSVIISSRGEYNGKKTDLQLRVVADANNPAVYVVSEGGTPLKLTARIERWRTAPYRLPEINVSDLLEDRRHPGNMHAPVVVEPDEFVKNGQNLIGWYHFNRKSVGFDLTNRLQGLSEYFTEDPILHRIFGAVITGDEADVTNDSTMQVADKLSVYVLTEHPSSPENWQKSIAQVMQATEQTPMEKRLISHKQWWEDFWNRSWLHADSDTDSGAFIVSRAYALQRFIDACAGRGRYPIKFNGSLFTVDYPDKPGGADYRRWGPGYWWQNTRLPYLSMVASGDFDLLQPFFKMYADDIFELSKYRTKKYFGFDGVYFPECMYFWGSVFTETYGWTPYEEREDPLQVLGYHKWEWVSGPELAFMMFDYFDYTQDTAFLKEKIISLAGQVIRFFDNYYKTGEDGKLIMHPSQAAETWWECTNPMTEVSGLIAITKRLLALPPSIVSESDRAYWQAFQQKIPPIPLRETPDGPALAPAEKFADKRNVENPELYAVFPFRLFSFDNPNPQWAVNALNHRWDKGHFGWRQDDIFMTYLGLTDQAREYLVARASEHDNNMRFPAFWGPNYDWTPDQDHGGILMRAFQTMVLQPDPYSEKLYLLPAWPENWNGEFRLHAPYNTIIEGTIKNGAIDRLKVTPESRRADIIIKSKPSSNAK